MLNWIPITTAPIYGEKPYDWSSRYKYQCTWFAYYRVQKNGYTPPCWHDKAKGESGWTTAKFWPENVRDPWVVYWANDKSYKPVPGDILVFDGNYGHVAVIEETVTLGEEYIISDYNRIQADTYDVCHWHVGDILKGYINTGKPKAYLHYEPRDAKTVTPVDRNPEVNQIEATDGTLRVRLAPNLSGEFYCFITPGYYNVLNKIAATEADKAQVDGLECWYEIEPGKFCANITTRYLPAENDTPQPTPVPLPTPDTNIAEELKKIFNDLEKSILQLESENTTLKKQVSDLEKENASYKQGLKDIADIVSKLIK